METGYPEGGNGRDETVGVLFSETTNVVGAISEDVTLHGTSGDSDVRHQ